MSEPQGLAPARAAEELAAAIGRVREVARRRGRTFLVAFAVSAAVIQLVGFFWPGTFEAQAALLLQKTRFAAGIDTEPKQPTTVMTGTVTEEEVNSEIAVLTSRSVLEATVKASGLDRIPPPWYTRVVFLPLRAYEWVYAWFHGVPYASPAARALASLGDSVRVERLKESNILFVSYRAGDPAFAEVVLDELLKHYLAWHVSVHSQMDVQPFFSEQATVLDRELGGLQDQLQAIKLSLGVADIGAEREMAMRQDGALREEDLMLKRRKVELDGRIEALQKAAAEDQGWTKTSTTTRPGSVTLDAMKNQLLLLELEEARLEARYQEPSPLLDENRHKLEIARRALEEERRSVAEESTVGLNPTLLALAQEKAKLAAERMGTVERLRILEGQLRDSRARLAVLDTKAVEADRLQLQLQSAKERYLMYLDRTEKARVDGAMDHARVANVSVVQHASASLKPVRPKRMVTLIVSIGGGLAIALLVCAWLELSAMGLARTLAAAAPPQEAA